VLQPSIGKLEKCMTNPAGNVPSGPLPTGPLKGLRVFDLTRVLAGPTCAQMLGDLGADVIKIERPGAGDDTRGFAPPFMPGTKESAYFVGVNRNKNVGDARYRKPEGQEIALRLIASAISWWRTSRSARWRNTALGMNNCTRSSLG
jgi:crotonobetainyl-CoA:carnitine CoA-transferase CaiB-like acyl-CoA transferase